MKQTNLLLLTLAVSSALFVTGCNRDQDATPAVEPAATMEPAPTVEPAPMPEPAAPAPAMDSGMSFADMDKNKDGGVAPDELAATEMLHQHFEQADTDRDGKLSQAEVDKHRADMAAMPGG